MMNEQSSISDRVVFSSLLPSAERLWGSPSLLSNWYRSISSEVKRPRCKANHLPPSGVDTKNELTNTTSPPRVRVKSHGQLYGLPPIFLVKVIPPLLSTHIYHLGDE